MAFSMPVAVLQEVSVATSLATLVDMSRFQSQPTGLSISDDEHDHDHRIEADDASNVLSMVPCSDLPQPTLVPCNHEDSVFGQCRSGEFQPQHVGFEDTVFFSITSGSMSRHTITGEKLKPFDFLAQRYRVVAGHDTQVHLVPAGAPVALSLRKLSFGVLIGQLVVWKLGQVDAVPFLHQSTMKLGIQSIKVFKAFTIAINHFIFVSSCSEVS